VELALRLERVPGIFFSTGEHRPSMASVSQARLGQGSTKLEPSRLRAVHWFCSAGVEKQNGASTKLSDPSDRDARFNAGVYVQGNGARAGGGLLR